MAATIRIAKVVHGVAGRIRIAKVSFFNTPGGPNARIRITKVGFFAAGGPQAKIRIAEVVFFKRDALNGTPLQVEFNGDSWQPMQGELVVFDGASWDPPA